MLEQGQNEQSISKAYLHLLAALFHCAESIVAEHVQQRGQEYPDAMALALWWHDYVEANRDKFYNRVVEMATSKMVSDNALRRSLANPHIGDAATSVCISNVTGGAKRTGKANRSQRFK